MPVPPLPTVSATEISGPLPRRRELSLLALLLLACWLLLFPATGSAHAELVRTDPPVNGLIIAPPTELHLYFSEEIAMSNPAPAIRVLDESGNEQAVTIVPDGREVTVQTPSLSPGIWTVSWTVKSATDGHILSGTYAFRIGGGIPAGAATTSGETPAVWAVIARWLTFFGVAVTGAGFLFGLVVDRESTRSASLPLARLNAIVIGALIGLLATIAEPVMLVVDPAGEESVSFRAALRSVPDAWWIRPPTLALALVCGLVSLIAMRGRLPSWLAIAGGLLSLGSLLGLSLTSHAAGRDSWREAAVALDIMHQWSVALWVGGLVHLAIWWPKRESAGVPAPMQRFSNLALGLFVVGVASGVGNAGFIFPAIDTLWNSDYGYVLIAKVAILVLPFALAIYHRQVIRTVQKSGNAVRSVMRTTLRIEVVAAAAVLLGGAALALSAPPIEEESGPDNVTLMQFAYDGSGEISGMVHLEVSPASQGSNQFTVWLTDIYGDAQPNDPPARVTLDFTSLNHGTTRAGTYLEPVDVAQARYSASGLDLSLAGWWEIGVKIQPSGKAPNNATFLTLLPDPNVHGFDAPPTPEEDPAAREVLERGIATMESMERFRWTERINTGQDTMVAAEIGQIAATGDVPMAYDQKLTYSGSFTPRFDGSSPPRPTINSYHSVTIGDQTWLVQEDGAWLEQPTSRYGTISDWGGIYDNAEHLQLGGTSEIDGETVQVITFHTPDQPGQAQAWFAWWVGIDSGRVYQMAMVAQAHYMTWDYSDFNGDWQIGPPPRAASEATPAVTNS